MGSCCGRKKMKIGNGETYFRSEREREKKRQQRKPILREGKEMFGREREKTRNYSRTLSLTAFLSFHPEDLDFLLSLFQERNTSNLYPSFAFHLFQIPLSSPSSNILRRKLL